jgi:hypothetical protein
MGTETENGVRLDLGTVGVVGDRTGYARWNLESGCVPSFVIARHVCGCGGIADPAYRGVWNVYTLGGPPSDDLCDLSPSSEFTFLMSPSMNKLFICCSSYILDE